MNTLYSRLAQLVDAYKRCLTTGNDEWVKNHTESLDELCKEHLPRGSGIDNGTQLDLDASNPNKLVFHTAYHHMNEGGMYDVWTEHKVIVTPDLMSGISLQITGPNRNDIKDYLHEVFGNDLRTELKG